MHITVSITDQDHPVLVANTLRRLASVYDQPLDEAHLVPRRISSQQSLAESTAPKTEDKTEPPKAEQPKPEPKAEQPKPEPKAEQPKPEPKAEQPKPEPKAEQPKPEPKAEQPKPEPKAEPAYTPGPKPGPTPEPPEMVKALRELCCNLVNAKRLAKDTVVAILTAHGGKAEEVVRAGNANACITALNNASTVRV